MTDPGITLDTVLVVNPNMVLRVEEDDAAILFDPDTGAVRVLNHTAVAIWRLLDGGRSLRDVIALLAEQYESMGGDAQEQVLSMARAWHQVGAVGTTGSSSP